MDRDKGYACSSLANIRDLYSQNVKEFGMTPKSVGWNDETSQELRFEKLVGLIDSQGVGNGFSVNDFGCGYGSMFVYLDRLFPGKLSGYFGYDISEEMLLNARRNVRDSRACFIKNANVTQLVDYTFVSGTFNVRMAATNKEWTTYIMNCILTLSAHSVRGFAFNLLTTYVDWKEEHLYYGDPLVFFDFCKRNCSPYVTLAHDYPLWEWSIGVRKAI